MANLKRVAIRYALALPVIAVIIVLVFATNVNSQPIQPAPHLGTAQGAWPVAALLHYANGGAAPARLFYASSGESGAVARELGGSQIPTSQNETLTYQPRLGH